MNDTKTENATPEKMAESISASAKLLENESEGVSSELELDLKSIELDLSSIDPEEPFSSEAVPDDMEDAYSKHSDSPDKVCENTVSLMESGAMSVETGTFLLSEVGKSGNALAYIYMGKLYSDERSEIYNPAIAFENYSHAADLNFGKGYYYLGLCYNSGLGCDVSYSSAFECFVKGAELEDGDCICALGVCREFGIGCEVDYAAAAELYAKAAEQDNVTAICNLGGCYLYGHGIAQDKEKAFELFKRAAELDSDVAECRLGVCLEQGDGCEQDLVSARAYYEIAASKDNAIALYRLALCHEKGVGAEPNLARAFKYYTRSASAGFAPAMYACAVMSRDGNGTKKDPSTAYKMFSLAADAGYVLAEYELGNCYLEGIGTGKNRDSAFKKYVKAYEYDNKNAKAAFKIGLCMLKGYGTAKNESEAFEWFCRGTELGSSAAAYMKGECFFFGVGITQEQSVAAMSFEKAISLAEKTEDAVPAAFALAQSLEYGLGVEKDRNRAIELYKRAAMHDSAKGYYHTGRAVLMSSAERAGEATRMLMLKAARKGYVPAMLVMGIFAEEGRGIPKNQKDAELWYKRVVNAELPKRPELYEFPERFNDDVALISEAKTEAYYRLGMMLAVSQTTPKECIEAFELIAMAASLGHEEARIEVTRFHMHGGDLMHYYDSDSFKENGEYDPDKDALGIAMNRLADSYFDGKTLVNKNPAAAVRCYKIAAELGNVDSCYSYGWCLRHGVGVRENDSESLKWLKMAADKGNAHAAYSYGLCCEEGAGTGIKNIREARSYYRKAAAAGHNEAAKRYMALSSEQY